VANPVENVRIAVVGCGYWGQNLVRNFWELDNIELSTVCDANTASLTRLRKRFPTIEPVNDLQEVLSNPKIDAVVLATPVSTHYDFARRALLAGKHVLVEKPMTTSTDEAMDLIELAEKQGRTLMVDHTFLYTSAVRRIKDLVSKDEIGDLLYFDSVRINLGLVQSDINVMWDLAPHDFAIMDHICDRDPISISAIGVNHLGCPYENMAYVTVRFNSNSNLIAHFHVNWLAPVKIRQTLIGGSKKMIVYDDMEPTEKVKIYDRGITMDHDAEQRTRMLTGYRNGDVLAPNLDTSEALRSMAKEFITSINEQRSPMTDGRAGYRVVRLLEAAQQSMELNGREIELGPSAFPCASKVLVGAH
jgi:predicted dehydrogenase